MNFDLSDDQRMLEDSLVRLVADQGGRGCGTNTLWSGIVDLGLTMLPFRREDGGLGLGGVETMLVGQVFGGNLVTVPYLASVVLAGAAIEGCPPSAERSRHLAAIIGGSGAYALADRERVASCERSGGWRVSGSLTLVLEGGTAEHIVVFDEGFAFIVAADAAGVTRRGYALHGGGGAADFVLHDAPATRLGSASPARAVEAGIAFLAAEAAGALAAALALTVDHLKTREQFGRLLAANQALQHRAAEMAVEVEQAHSAAIYAALLAREPDEDERARGYSAVKAVIGAASAFVAQQTVQLHGGIGVSEEHVSSRYFRRLTAIGLLFGDSEAHLARLASLGGFTTAIVGE